MKIRTIILDYAGVITPTQDNYVFAQRYSNQFNVNPLELMEITYKNWDAAILNQVPASEFWAEIGKELNTDPEKIRNMIIETFPIEQKIIDLIDSLKQKYTFVLMSNQVEDWLEKVIDDNNLRGRFDYFINSYQVKLKKPDRRIFEKALKITHTPVDECLFVDDQEKNINAASALGIKTIKFNTYEQFLEELKVFIPEVRD